MVRQSKKSRTKLTEETFTQVTPVIFCSDEAQINQLMHLCGTVRAVTYNRFGSLKGWGLNWMFVAPVIRGILAPENQGMGKCKKIWEWAVNDTAKAILAQQEAAKFFLLREIWRKCPMQHSQKERTQWLEKNGKTRKAEALSSFPKCPVELERERLFELLDKHPDSDNWLHRKFRNQYLRGHTFLRNQIVYQGAGYSCHRLNRHSVELQVMGIDARKKITLILRCRQIIKGQIRLIRNDAGLLEVHHTRKRTLAQRTRKPNTKMGVDKGYTEAFYTSEGQVIGAGLGAKLTEKTNRITNTNRNRYRLRTYAQNLNDPAVSARILENNLGYKTKTRKLQREKATIQNLIRRDLRSCIAAPVQIFCEDLNQSIKSKARAKAVNRKLNQWMKGELQASLEKIALETGSSLILVNCAYTSQIDSLTGTLLGRREGDCFIRYTGVVLHADRNAASNIRDRGTDTEISRYMKSGEVETVLLNRTVRYLTSIGKSIAEALSLGWLHPKFGAKALRLEAEYHPQG